MNKNATKVVNDYIISSKMESIKSIVPNTLSRTITVIGIKDGYTYSTTIFSEEYNCAKEYVAEQVKKLHNAGYTQNEIAAQLGISQGGVSIYVRALNKEM